MGPVMFSILMLLFFGPCARAAILTPYDPSITPAPALLEARAVTTVGYLSTGSADGTTLWAPITLNGQNLIIATQGSIYRLCDPSLPCEFFSCSRSYAVFPSSSVSCGGPSSTCSSYILASDVNDSKPLTNYWCDDIKKTGGTVYRTTPNGNDATSTPTGDSESSSAPTTSTTIFVPPLQPQKSSTPVGAIVGGVVGGLAVLGAIIVAVIFLLRRKRKTASPAAATVHYPQAPMGQPPMQPMPQQQFYNPAQSGYGPPEKTPAATSAEMNNYYMGPASPTSPAPQYSSAPPPVNFPNELPTQRM